MDKTTKQDLLDIVKNNYEQMAADFSTSRQKLFWPELQKLAIPVKAGDRVLDLGCGQGRLLEIFKDRSIDYLGLDQSASLIKIAKINYPTFNFQVLNLESIDKLSERNFNYIFCVAVLHHIPGTEERVVVLRKMAEKLAPGGQIIISVWNLWNRRKFLKLILKFWLQRISGRHKMDRGDILFPWGGKEGVGTRYYHAFTGGELKKISRSANLKIEKLYKDRFNYYLVLKKD
jgi:2-polyprenyl-3-methyl-5-hydroxy-6-metoxy-1,4-benzoquinol methylase